MPGPSPGRSATTVAAAVGDGSELRWMVQPTVLALGCDQAPTARAFRKALDDVLAGTVP